MKIRLLILFILLVNIVAAQSQFQGFGAQVTGGTGKPVMHVTNLNATGSGSLASLMGSNRIIVFDVGGTVNNFAWDADNYNNVQNVTIDGTTAPFPGITLINNNNGNGLSFNQNCFNIIVKNIRMRGNAGNDAMNLVGAHDVVFDHCSISGAHDGNLDITEGSYNVSVQWCIIGGGSSDWSGAMLLGYVPTKNLSVHHNLFCAVTNGGVGERIPFIRANESSANYNDMIVEFRNNLVYKWGRAGGTGSGYATGFDFAGTGMAINNYYYSPSSPGAAVQFNVDPTAGSGYKAYVNGNVSGNGSSFPTGNVSAWVIPSWAAIPNQGACVAAQLIKSNAGCRPLDATDQAYMNGITLPNCQTVTPLLWASFLYNTKYRQLEWSTASEQNNEHFEIEVSDDASMWTVIGQMPSKAVDGNSSTTLNYTYSI